LEWCTQKENAEHAVKNKRFPIGERNTSAKLSEKDVLRIRKLGRDYGLRKLSREYSVGYNAVSDVILNKTWKHI